MTKEIEEVQRRFTPAQPHAIHNHEPMHDMVGLKSTGKCIQRSASKTVT